MDLHNMNLSRSFVGTSNLNCMKYELTRVPVLPFAMTLARKKCKISLTVINPIFILLTKEHIHSNIHPGDLGSRTAEHVCCKPSTPNCVILFCSMRISTTT